MLKTRQILLFTLIGLLQFPVFAQFPYIEKIRVPVPTKEPVFSKAMQDSDGYLWLGSDQGLFRFDGINFKSFYPPIESVDFQITALFEGNDGVLWIGCKNGKIYRLDYGAIYLFNPEEGTAGQAITDILTDHDGTLWWSTTGEGIYFYENGRVYNINHDDGLNDDYVYDLECDRNGLIWAGTDAGLFSCRVENNRKIVSPLDPGIALPDIIVKVIREDQAGNLWLGFQDGGTGYLVPDHKRFVNACNGTLWPYGPLQDIATPGKAMWFATASGEIVEIDPEKVKSPARSIIAGGGEFGRINDLLEDREGNVWIVANTGLYRTTGTRFSFYNQTAHGNLENIHAVRNDIFNEDVIWFSNDEGLFSMDLFRGTTKKYLENFKAPDFKGMCLDQDKYGYIWVGTFNYGVLRIRPGDGTWIQVTEDQGLVNNNVLSISRHEDTLWMATLGGASEIVLTGNESHESYKINSFDFKTGLANNFIYSVYEDNHDQIWLATDGDGINVRTKKGWITYDEKNGLTDDVIYSITGDKYGNIWIASASKGIFKYNDEKFIHYGIEDGLSSLAISGIIAVEEEIVIVHDNGLDILHIPSGKIAHYGEKIGLSGISPDLNVICRDAAGNIWIGTRKGIIRYQPGNEPTSYGPQTVLEEMSIYLEPRLMENDLVLAHDKNHVAFKYAGLWFSNPESVIYQVYLEGYDLGWKDTYDRMVTYSNLSPGSYTFKVRSATDQSFRSASEASYDFRIREPFWFSLWFIILLVFIVTAAIYFFIRFREDRLRQSEQEKKEKVEFEFQVLKNQVNPHFLFNSFSTLMSLIEEQPDQALQYTEKLSDFFRTILQFKDQELIHLDEEIALIGNYFFLMKKRFGENINLEISLKDELKKTFIPPMTLQILVENAIKHNIISKDKPLFIRIYEDGGKIIVENNLQPKLMAEVSTGIGLENIRKRYRLITKEEPVIEKAEGLFRVRLPGIRG